VSFHCYKYQLSFDEVLQNSQTSFEHRQGFILEYDKDGFAFWGEVAPLPGYSRETLEDVEELLQSHKENLEVALSNDEPINALQPFYDGPGTLPPSLQFGLDTLAYQIKASRENVSLQKLLFEKNRDKIAVNALLSLHSNKLFETLDQQLQEGFKTVKFKIGIDFNQELNKLNNIRSQYPDLKIRLDLNQGWTLKEALRNCPKLLKLDIEYCEEPLKEVTPKNYEILSEHCDLPLALDESVVTCDFWPNLLPYTSFIILKPMLLGSFNTIFETKRLADTLNNKAVITTSLESGIGRNIIAILASGLGAAKTAQGLATGRMLAQDVYSDFKNLKNGYYNLGDREKSSEAILQKIHQVSTRIF